MAMANVMDAAHAVQQAHGLRPLPWRKLHKLLYFCQGWGLAWTGEPLFGERIEAWIEGPVVRDLYRIQKYYAQTANGSADLLTHSEKAIVYKVVRFYGRYHTKNLIALSHREPPWRMARHDVPTGAKSKNEIRQDTMREYFSQLAAAGTAHELDEGLRRTIDVLLSVQEDQVDALLTDSGVDFEAELAYLRGQGSDPWPQSAQSQNRH
jgi:uncharacterized phage-associated protein